MMREEIYAASDPSGEGAGGHHLWYMCKYSPLELISGFGVKADRLESVMDSFDMADAAAHPNICGYGKALLEACMQPKVEEVVLVNCCDVARRVYDVLKEQKSCRFLYLLDLPHDRNRGGRWLFEHILERFISAYASYSGLRFDFRRAWSALEKQKEDTGSILKDKPHISLQGAHGGPGLMELVQSHFSIPVTDDTCSGNRRIEAVRAPESASEFLHLYAAQLLNQTPCMRMEDISGRSMIGAGAEGIIYHTMKFCDYYGFEYAKKAQDGSPVPVLKIETDSTRQSQGQLATRLDAFAESLRRQNGTKRVRRTMSGRQYVAGIDSGSTSTDVVIMNRDREIVSWSIIRTGAGAAKGAERALEEAVAKAGCSRDDISEVIATGYGRTTIGLGDDAVTEITCHAKGAFYLNPATRTIIDIGGQDSKVIRIDDSGAVQNFVMNDKCAAGTGRFLEMMARTLELSMDELEARGKDWSHDITISNMCTVFAESEVVSLIAQNTETADIIHGLNKAVAAKTAALVRRVKGEPAYMMTGGVAKNTALVAELEKRLDVPIFVSEHAQLCGAIGAALIALE